MYSSSYRFKFYLNAMHSVKISNIDSSTHPHTWEMVLYITKLEEDDFVQFTETENDVELFLSMYERQLLNEIPPFDTIVPTMENIGEVFFKQIINLLKAKGWALQKLEISENASRSFILTNNDDNT